jgi:hypothetical protein
MALPRNALNRLDVTSLDRLVNLLVNKRGSHHVIERAIRLYEFQVAIFYQQSYIDFLHNENENRGSNHRLRSARLRAAIILQDHFRRPNDKRMCRRIIDTNGGLPGAMDSRRPRPVHWDIRERRRLAEPVVSIVHVSYSYARTPDRPLHRGIIGAAKYIVREKLSWKRTKINGRWSKFKSVAIFLYLLEQFPLMPPNVSARTFAPKLLAQTENIKILRRFFRAYQHLHKVLTPIGYRNLPNISLKLRCAEPELPWSPMEKGMIEKAFRRSKEDRES